ncbi:hypothetical protein T484DRAFT_3311892 [Baffinella frigidus]|nr:hypothetical protein T484DRAFT_3311892 [Cryptophyta sp. CCMP2293]
MDGPASGRTGPPRDTDRPASGWTGPPRDGQARLGMNGWALLGTDRPASGRTGPPWMGPPRDGPASGRRHPPGREGEPCSVALQRAQSSSHLRREQLS